MKVFTRLAIILMPLFNSFSVAFPQGFPSMTYNGDPISLNPSLTGDVEGAWRASLNYNELKILGIPFKNYTISFDQPFYLKSKKFGVGISATHDEISDNVFNKEKVFLSGAYFSQYRNNLISVGIQAGYVLSNIKLGNEIWPDQYNRLLGIYETSISSNENIQNRVSYADVNLGLLWKKILPRHIAEAGLVLVHLNSPKVSYISNSDVHLKPVFVFHGADNWILSQKVYLTPSVLYRTNAGENYLNYGASCSYKFPGNILEKSVFAGIGMKNGYGQFYAISFSGGIRYNQWQFGASYDYNMTSAKTNFSIQGPFEIYIRYISLSSRIQNFSIPCPRF
jgi:type IX secretion system PorP/SprF family membrane protein